GARTHRRAAAHGRGARSGATQRGAGAADRPRDQERRGLRGGDEQRGDRRGRGAGPARALVPPPPDAAARLLPAHPGRPAPRPHHQRHRSGQDGGHGSARVVPPNVSLILVYLAILVGLSWRLTIVTLVLAPVIVLIIWWGMKLALRPELFIAFVALALRLMSPVKAVVQYPAIMAGAVAAADRCFEVLDVPADEGDRPGETPARFGDRIEYRGVTFSYDGEAPVLRDVDLEVRRGQIVAIVGPSGAGKTTLVDLLPRFYEPTGGVISIDGVPISRFTRRSLRGLMGIVSQETVLLNDTVHANIAYGRGDFTLEQVRAAARAANADE